MGAGLMSMLTGLFSSGAASGAAGATGGGLMDMLNGYSDKMGGAKSMMSGPVPGAPMQQNSLDQALSGKANATNPLMSSTIGSQAPPATTTPAPSKGKWKQYAQQQDVSAGLAAAKPDNPMYDQMMQQAQQGVVNNQGAQGQQQQPQRQMMTPAGMPQMPGAVHPNATWDTLLKMLSGGG